MIKDRKTLKEYMAADAQLYPKVSGGCLARWKNWIVTNPQNTQRKIYSYIRNLRQAEYHENNGMLAGKRGFIGLWHTACMLWYYWRLRRLSYTTGIQIAPGSFGKGLQIWHYGSIIVNARARIGDYATIYPGTVIGAKDDKCPQLGDNVFVGAGSKVLGGVKIGDNVTIAPNAVVVKDVPDGCTVAGVPAKIIKFKEPL